MIVNPPNGTGNGNGESEHDTENRFGHLVI